MSFEFFHPFGTPNFIAALAMFLWIPFVFLLFRALPTQRAIVIAFIIGTLFLPEVQLIIPGFPDYTKISAASYVILIYTLVSKDSYRIRQFRLHWFDIPMLIWCITPFFSYLANDLSSYDALSATLEQTMKWGVPFFLGRIYLNDVPGLRNLAIGIFAGGVAYIPFCIFEMRMAPQLHMILYGGFPHDSFAQAVRGNGFRPTVFVRHGLILSFIMITALVVGVWLWKTGILKKIFGIPMIAVIPIFFLTDILLRSTGAYITLLVALVLLFSSVLIFRSNLGPYLMIGGVVFYLFVVITYQNPDITNNIINFLSGFVDPERIDSLKFRFDNENILLEKAKQQLFLGWGGYGRNFVVKADEWGETKTVVDSLWIITIGSLGLLGLISLFSSVFLPVISLLNTKSPVKVWDKAEFAAPGVLSLVLLMYSVEILVNAPVLPHITLVMGALTGYVLAPNRRNSSWGGRTKLAISSSVSSTT
ncbi:MAG: O-antigen ligase domain-containing protein [Nodosilinea sp.]